MSEGLIQPSSEGYSLIREKYANARLLLTLKLSRYNIGKYKKGLDTESMYTIEELVVIFKRSIEILLDDVSRSSISSPGDILPSIPVHSQIYRDAFFNCGEIISVFPEFKPILEDTLRLD